MKLTLVLILIFTSISAHALVIVEPLLGYGTGKFNDKFSSSGVEDKVTPSMKGLSYGMRGGLSLLGLQLGGEMVRNSGKATGGGLDEDLDVKADEYSAFLGYRFLFLRLYGGYIARAQLLESSVKEGGTGFKVGGTFYAFSNLAVSLEYKSVKFDRVDEAGGDYYVIDYNSSAVVLSFPFEI